jgi:hypothetical protein
VTGLDILRAPDVIAESFPDLPNLNRKGVVVDVSVGPKRLEQLFAGYDLTGVFGEVAK